MLVCFTTAVIAGNVVTWSACTKFADGGAHNLTNVAILANNTLSSAVHTAGSFDEHADLQETMIPMSMLTKMTLVMQGCYMTCMFLVMCLLHWQTIA